ncbi:MAG TPA: PLP-dependent aminotransferase family protein [Candidatus Acidoferrales bacterium]|nr:PLP-dependent aminotransferase family protein [Candidatus Acidoferrales bacterium]
MKRVPSIISPILAVTRKAPKSLYRQVYDAYRKAILEGNLRAGQRVPSSRVQAAELGVSRIPVLNAYAQLLAEGYFESRVGSGTVVSRSLPERSGAGHGRPETPAMIAPARRAASRRCAKLPAMDPIFTRRSVGPFLASQIAAEYFPLRTWNRLVTRHARRADAGRLDYGDPMGLRELREAIAAHLRTARGVRCEPGQILMVTGSQQGLAITARVLLDAGNRVWMEEPGYMYARRVFEFSGCKIVPVSVDGEGLNVGMGVKRCRKARAALVTPSHQYPLGVTMSASRRLQLLDWAESNGSWIIEDDYDSEYRYESMPVTSLQGLDRNSRVVYIGTFSKVLFPSLRLGYVVAPEDLVERFLAVRFAMDIGPATFPQAVLADFLREGHFSRHIRRMRAVYAERRGLLIQCLQGELGSRVEIGGAEAGMHFCMMVKGISDREVAERAATRGIALVPLSRLYFGKAKRQGFIVGFGSTSTEQIPGAVRKLREAIVG